VISDDGHCEVRPLDPLVVSMGADGVVGPAVSRGLAHSQPGVLHLAVSLQIVDAEDGWLLQRRAGSKAAFAGCWANTCCTHPAPDEDPAVAVIRRVREELGLGLAIDQLIPAGVFTYRAVDPVSGLIEQEVDHVFAAVTPTGAAVANAEEIGEVVRLTYAEAMEVVTSESGAPWAAEVLRLAAAALSER
jgi:isopentenyl-diphosphate delta-isomerase